MIEANKLVRDNICDLIEQRGGTANYHILSDEEYKKALLEKLREEIDEYEKDKNIEEIADIMEVIMCVISQSGFTMDEIYAQMHTKREKNGSFLKKIFLESYEEGDKDRE